MDERLFPVIQASFLQGKEERVQYPSLVEDVYGLLIKTRRQ